ncbi:WD40-repeat-containing domain protein [Melanogaster broomeanus]|nr:WD40-repeat-containing domain protein [Melanogaster broomeanus]
MSDNEQPSYCHRRTLQIPAQVSCLALGEPRQLFAGSDDGSVRVYDMATFKVLTAIRGLAAVSSIALHSQAKSSPSCLWVASGRQVLSFHLGTDKLILTSCGRVDEDDVVNEISINAKGAHMAFCTDSGAVGIVDLSTDKITHMRKSHISVCGTVRFIPDRPSELISGGYDSALLHFDFLQGSVLSRDDLSAAPPTSGVSMSPPFILSLTISSSGVIAAGTADGRVYIGTGGEKLEGGGRQKRSRKWDGLRGDGRIVAEVAQGPIAALTFTAPRELLTCTLLGSVTYHQISGSAADGTLALKAKWTRQSSDILKVNSITTSEGSIIIGGFQRDGRGVIEIWSKTGDVNNVNTSISG